MIEAVHKRRLAAQVAESLRRYVDQRQLGPGDRLPPERELAAALAVSRNVVREALRELEREGLVATSHGQGNFIRSARIAPAPSGADGQASGGLGRTISRTDALEARSVFEAGLADLIVERATDAEVDQIAAAVAEMRRRVADERPTGYEEIAFHELLLRCSHNPALIAAGQTLVLGYLRDYMLQTPLGPMLERPEVVDVEEHAEIFAAIRQRDTARLHVLLRYHGYPQDSPDRTRAGLLPYWVRGRADRTVIQRVAPGTGLPDGCAEPTDTNGRGSIDSKTR